MGDKEVKVWLVNAGCELYTSNFGELCVERSRVLMSFLDQLPGNALEIARITLFGVVTGRLAW
jgi:hypothetical protein